MAARPVSKLANWEGRLDQQRQDSKWRRRSSSSLGRDPYHTSLGNQPFEIFQPPGRFSDQKRVEQSASRSTLDRDSLANPPGNARLPSRVDTTSTPLHGIHQFHHPSISHSIPNPAPAPPPFIASSKSSHITPNSSVITSRVHTSRPPSLRGHNASLQPTSTTESDVIDLTIEDTEDESSVSNTLVPNNLHFGNQHADPGPSCRPSSSGHSSPIAPERSLFTPPPPRRRIRLFMDYLAAPAFPKGLTKADYQPMSGHSVVPLPSPIVTSALKDSVLAESSATKPRTPSPQKWKGKEREHGVSPRKQYKRRAPPKGADLVPSPSLDAIYEPTMIPLHDDDDYPPLTTLDLATNTRFQFAHAWRGYASRLRETESDWTFKFRLLGKACIWARSADISSPRIPGTTGSVSIEQLRPWELVLPDSSPQEKSSKHISDEQADATGSHSLVEGDTNYLPLPDDALPGPSDAFDPAPSNSTLSQSFSSAAIDTIHDMNQYFNGLSDSLNKPVPPCQQPAPAHTFRPHLLQPAGHAQMNPLALGFPSLELDSRLADTGGHECFLGVPSSPTAADMESSIVPGLTSDSPFEPVNYLTASPSNIFAEEAPPTGAWLFEPGEGLLPGNNSPPNDHVTPTALGTIDPSLLGLEQPETPSRPPKDTPPKRRSKLPEPVIYVRRPIDSSTLPLVSGKRPVQIKYRDPEGSSATPSTQSVSKQVSSNPVEHPIELSTDDPDDSPRAKRVSAPSRKLREYHTASQSDSDFIPETSKFNSKPKPKLKQPSAKDKKSVAEHQGTDAGTVSIMSFCHQCRNKSVRPKMLCSNVVGDRVCGKRFCNRCILYRYPDITFDEHSASFLCPACTNTCNCSCCSRSRGEEFVSMRLGGLAASILKNKVMLVRDVDKPLHRVNSPRTDADTLRNASEVTTPTPEPGTLPTQSKFWAHVYGIEGEHVGSAFMTREQMGRLQTRVPSPSPPLPKPQPRPQPQPQPPGKKVEKPRRREKKQEKKTTGPRVFIGRPLESWKVRTVRDLEPSVNAGTIQGKGKGKGKGKGTTADNYVVPTASDSFRRGRCYIGNPVALHEPYGRMPGMTSPTPPSSPSSRCSTPAMDSDGSLTPLSELETDYWPQPKVGECCSWAPPPPPGTVVHGLPLDPSGLSGSFVGGLSVSGPGILGAVGTEIDVVGLQGLSLGAGADVEMGVKMDVDVDAAANGDERGSVQTVLSQEDVVRAISAALAALSVELPP